ncbi:MAG: prepilin-type N-terminal cleavage/methylation domain-containing protein [Candidatus Krumholzibacteria bacterium]|nr:prepilin-type N-terminal cleavage/methylation domain-containing protein [Candidatus Krumholzibacteria bacterium]
MRIPTRSRGFSIIELMIVVTIIGIITSIVLPNYMRFAKRAKDAVVQENMHTMQLAIEAFSVGQLGSYPQPADEAVFKGLMPGGLYPNNPFTNAETTILWNADPVGAGEISIFNLPGGGYRLRGQGANAFLKDIVAGD